MDYDSLAQRLGRQHLERRLRYQAVFNEAMEIWKGGTYRNRLLPNLGQIACFLLNLTRQYERGRRNLLDIQVERLEFFLPNLPEGADGLRVLHLSDLHAECHPGLVPRVVQELVALEGAYDLCLHTGDFRNHELGGYRLSETLSAQVVAAVQAPQFGVLGNHDFIEQTAALEAAGIRMLLNEAVAFSWKQEDIWLVGIDDPSIYRTHDFGRALRDVPPGAFTILLAHAPNLYREAAAYGFDLQLGGHCHGGQVALPWGQPLLTRLDSPNRVCVGTWREAGLLGHTSRGLGGTFPIRFFCPPEIGILTLRRGPLTKNRIGRLPRRRRSRSPHPTF